MVNKNKKKNYNSSNSLIFGLWPQTKARINFFQIVLEQCNHPAEVQQEARVKFGLESSVVVRRRAGRELLSVAKFFRA